MSDVILPPEFEPAEPAPTTLVSRITPTDAGWEIDMEQGELAVEFVIPDWAVAALRKALEAITA